MRGSQLFKKLLRDNRGATAIEYGLIASLIVIAIIGAVSAVADEQNGLWAIVEQNITTAM
jgi:pilus assembly protein Flp/PilA